MDVGAAFVADPETAELVPPGDRAFHHPPQTAEAGVVVGAAAGQPRLDALDVQHHLAEVGVIRLVGRHRVGAATRGADLPRTGGIASTSGRSMVPAWTLAAVTTATIGVPSASVRMWCLLPGLPRSVGFGPVASPPQPHAPTMRRRPYETSPVARRR